MLRRIDEIGREHGLRITNVFHAGDGNVHPIFLYDDRDEEQVQNTLRAAQKVLQFCVDVGGTITGEHGVGVEKIHLMPYLFDERTMNFFARVKTAFDPQQRINPGKMLASDRVKIRLLKPGRKAPNNVRGLQFPKNRRIALFSSTAAFSIIPALRALLRDILDPATRWGALALGILFLAAAIIAARLLHLWVRRLTSRSPAMIDPTAISFFGQLAQVVCFVAAIIMYAHLVPALQRLGEAMLASAGLVSLIIGLAAQNTLGNLIAGLSLLLYRPFAIGDVLAISAPTGAATGTVKEFTLGHTKLMTDDGRWIIVPNSIMASNVIVRVK